MAPLIKSLSNSVDHGGLLGPATFEDVDLDSALDERDEDEFDGEWVRCNEEVQRVLEDQCLDSDEVAELAQRSFVAVSEATGQHEVASYVSDDFRLIAEALLAGYDDPWLVGLFSEYADGRFPSGAIERLDVSLADAVNRFEG